MAKTQPLTSYGSRRRSVGTACFRTATTMRYLLPLILLSFFITSCGDKSVDQRVRDIDNKRVLSTGMELWVEDGANLSQIELDAIVRGMQDCFARAQARGYQHPISLNYYTVVIFSDVIKGDNGAYHYKIPVKGTGYEGSPYDHDGYIHVAGQYLDNRTDRNIIILPDYQDDNLDILANTAGYEIEHSVLRHSDLAAFYRTRIHTPLTPHPLF